MPTSQKSAAIEGEQLRRLCQLTDCVYAVALVLVVQFLPLPEESSTAGESGIWLYQLFGEFLANELAAVVGLVFIIVYWLRRQRVAGTPGTHGRQAHGVLHRIRLLSAVPDLHRPCQRQPDPRQRKGRRESGHPAHRRHGGGRLVARPTEGPRSRRADTGRDAARAARGLRRAAHRVDRAAAGLRRRRGPGTSPGCSTSRWCGS